MSKAGALSIMLLAAVALMHHALAQKAEGVGSWARGRWCPAKASPRHFELWAFVSRASASRLCRGRVLRLAVRVSERLKGL